MTYELWSPRVNSLEPFQTLPQSSFKQLLGVVIDKIETIPKGELLLVPARLWEID